MNDENETGTADQTADQAAAATAAERRAQLQREYGQWEAATDISTATGLAYAAGHPVPASNVDEDGRVVLARHQCDGDPACGGSARDRCERFNEPTHWTAPGAAVKVG